MPLLSAARDRARRVITLWCVLACAATSTANAADTDTLVRQTGLDAQAIELVLSQGGAPRQLMGRDDAGMDRPARGLTVQVPRGRGFVVAGSLRRLLGPSHAVSVSRRADRDAPFDDISLMRTADPYEVLRAMGTQGWSQGVSPQRVIERLKHWDRKYGLQLAGAGPLWVQAQIKRLPARPQDWRALALEVAELCPSVLDENAGSIDTLAFELSLTQSLSLRWPEEEKPKVTLR
jgi:hypothetical protein